MTPGWSMKLYRQFHPDRTRKIGIYQRALQVSVGSDPGIPLVDLGTMKHGGRSMIRGILSTMLMLLLSGAMTSAFAQDSYRGKTIRIVVGLAAGGGFDAYARAIARHLGKQLPGNPAVIVENMPGAGSLISANHVYRVAKPDGLTIGHFVGGLFFNQLFGLPGIEFDARKFEYIGAPLADNPVCVLMKATGIDSMEKWLASKTPVKMAGNAPGGVTDDIPKTLKAAIGLPVQVVSGYKGTADMRMAAESGEVGGICLGWDSVRGTWRKGVESGEAKVIVQAMPNPHPDLLKIPLAISYAKSEEARQLIAVGIHSRSAVYRPYVLPPATPKRTVEFFRKAFTATLQDPSFLEDAKKANLDVAPIAAEELQKEVSMIFSLKSSTVDKLKEILK
jgi:tripartite-type tricarboxylate transporter receptor subunit TctC